MESVSNSCLLGAPLSAGPAMDGILEAKMPRSRESTHTIAPAVLPRCSLDPACGIWQLPFALCDEGFILC